MIVAGWMREEQAHRSELERRLRRLQAARSARMDRDALAASLRKLGDLVDVLRDAKPSRKAKIYAELGLELTYYPSQRKVLVAVTSNQDSIGSECVSEGRVEPFAYLLDQGERWLELD